MRAAKVQASLRIRAVSPEPSLLAHTSSESRGTFRQKARSLAPLNGWTCAVKVCHDGMLEDTNSLDGAHFMQGPMICKLCNRVLNCVHKKESKRMMSFIVFSTSETDAFKFVNEFLKLHSPLHCSWLSFSFIVADVFFLSFFFFKYVEKLWTIAVVVVLVFYDPSTLFRSFRARSVNLSTLILGNAHSFSPITDNCP